MKPVAAAIAALAAVMAALAPPPSGAAFTAATASPGNGIATATVTSYLRLWSQSTDPDGLTGYGVKRLSNPSVLAATGSDRTLAVALGAWKMGGGMDRVLTLQARNPLPVPSITVTASVVPGSQDIGPASIAAIGASGGTGSVTLTAGAKRQINLVIPKMPGNNLVQTSTLVLTVTYPGFTDSFYSYRVPVSLWDGNGTGP